MKKSNTLFYRVVNSFYINFQEIQLQSHSISKYYAGCKI